MLRVRPTYTEIDPIFGALFVIASMVYVCMRGKYDMGFCLFAIYALLAYDTDIQMLSVVYYISYLILIFFFFVTGGPKNK